MNNSHLNPDNNHEIENIACDHFNRSLGKETDKSLNDLQLAREAALSRLDKQASTDKQRFLRYALPSAVAACLIVAVQLNGSLVFNHSDTLVIPYEYQEAIQANDLLTYEDEEFSDDLEEDAEFFHWVMSEDGFSG